MSLRPIYIVAGTLLLGLCPYTALAATLSLDQATSTYGPGDTFIETIRIDNEGDCINAANIALAYPKETLRAVDFSRGDSIFSLWAVEPHIDTDAGTIVFAGGVPGGYCGRIAGDAALSNVLGKVIFTVVSATAPKATIHFAPASAVYLNDGAGTLAKLHVRDATITLVPTAQLASNQWLSDVADDHTPPQPFTVQVESTSGVFGGRYYIVFSTTDKESGLDHYEISENGVWKRISSPYLLKNQSLLGIAGDIQVRAIDKAGNIRMGDYSPAATPKRQLSFTDLVPFLIWIGIILLIGGKWYIDHKRRKMRTTQQG